VAVARLDPAERARLLVPTSGGLRRHTDDPVGELLVGHHVDIVAVLDGDEPGRREGRKLVERLLGDENRTVFAGDYTPDGNTTGETEDLFPDSYYLAAVRQACGSIDLRFNADEKQFPKVVDRLTAVFERKGHGEFEKWKVARALADQIEADPSGVPSETLDAASRIFQKVNALLGI
jgi:hypothetical protein